MKEHKKFNAFDKVLVKDSGDVWQIDFYSHWSKEKAQHITLAYGDGLRIEDSHILPYEGNEHLLGTTDEPEEEIKLNEGEHIICFDSINQFNGKNVEFRVFKGLNEGSFSTNYCCWRFAIRFSEFIPADMEETKKHILCVKNGKIVRYKG